MADEHFFVHEGDGRCSYASQPELSLTRPEEPWMAEIRQRREAREKALSGEGLMPAELRLLGPGFRVG